MCGLSGATIRTTADAPQRAFKVQRIAFIQYLDRGVGCGDRHTAGVVQVGTKVNNVRPHLLHSTENLLDLDRVYPAHRIADRYLGDLDACGIP